MSRPVTLFTGQWADLPLAVLAEKASSWGYDGLELACWGDHFDVLRAAEDPDYCVERRELLQSHDLDVWAVAESTAGGVETLLRGDARLWLGGDAGTVPLAVRTQEGAGTALFTSFHNESQNTFDMDRLLEEIIFSL